MKLRVKFLLLLVVNISAAVSGQATRSPLSSCGNIPSDIIQKPHDKYLNDINQIDTNTSRFQRKIEEQFYLKSNYVLDYCYRSGQVSFNNELNIYVNTIADYLLEDEKDLRSKLSIYIISSSEFNAFVINDGSIFISTGLLAKVTSEAQVAFVLAHEIAHFVLHHTEDAYLEKATAKVKKGEYENLNYDYVQTKLSNYSKEQELIADKEGLLRYYLKTQYASGEVVSLMDIMLYSYLPLVDNENLLGYFEGLGYVIPDAFKLREVNAVIAVENYSDSLSTHPNIKIRKENIKAIVSNENVSVTKNFIQPKEQFFIIQKLARFDLTNSYMRSLQYEMVICNSFFLLEEYENGLPSEYSIGFALMQLAAYKVKTDFDYIHQSHSDIQGSTQRVNYLFEKLSDVELSVLALLYNWRLTLKYPNNKNIECTCESAFRTLIIDLGYGLNDLNDEFLPESEHIKNPIISYLNDDAFCNQFVHYENIANTIRCEKEDLITNAEARKVIKKQNKVIKKKGFALGIDTIVVVNPLCNIYNYSKEDVLQWKESDNLRYLLVDYIQNYAQGIDLKVDILDLKYLDEQDVEAYNDYCSLSNWFFEKCVHYSDDYNLYNAQFVAPLIKKYGTKYFAWASINIDKNSPQFVIKKTTLDFYVFDIETGEKVLSQREYLSLLESGFSSKLGVGNILKQIKKERK